MNITLFAVRLVALYTIATPTFAVVGAEKYSLIGSTLTPVGAEISGNIEGTIPAWSGGLPLNAGGIINGFRADPYAGETPLFVIDASNYTQYADNLTPGHVAMFKRYPNTYKMPVYTSHRSAGVPTSLAVDVKYNALNTRLVEDGNGLQDFKTAIPFPLPANGLEVIWNHIARYRAGSLKRQTTTLVPQPSGQFTPVNGVEYFSYADNVTDYKPGEKTNILFYYKSLTTEPARMAGGVLLVHETLNQVKEPRMAWFYSAGQRRVRRAPQVAYDGAAGNNEGLKTSDGLELFNGAPDRYDWKLEGKREIYIPYNSYRMGASDVKYKDLATLEHLNPQYARYELHRVWEVTATLKNSERHIYAKRSIFIDEDSWTIALADHYDSRGTLWRVGEAHLQYFYDVQATFQTPEVIYDLIAGRYVATGLINERSNAYDFSYRAAKSDYTPAALRSQGIR